MKKKLSIPVIVAIAAVALFQFITKEQLSPSQEQTAQLDRAVQQERSVQQDTTDKSAQSFKTAQAKRRVSSSTDSRSATPTKSSNDSLAHAIAAQSQDVQVEGEGQVVKILPDDNDGSRHQRLIVRIAPRQTILIAHNIDLAPRVASLKEGDTISFYGEYVWNDKGGLIHWTHKDPSSRHVAGWIKHNGNVYQ